MIIYAMIYVLFQESDVDIITCDLKETLAPGKRKTRYNASDDDDPQNKKFKLDEVIVSS